MPFTTTPGAEPREPPLCSQRGRSRLIAVYRSNCDTPASSSAVIRFALPERAACVPPPLLAHAAVPSMRTSAAMRPQDVRVVRMMASEGTLLP